MAVQFLSKKFTLCYHILFDQKLHRVELGEKDDERSAKDVKLNQTELKVCANNIAENISYSTRQVVHLNERAEHLATAAEIRNDQLFDEDIEKGPSEPDPLLWMKLA